MEILNQEILLTLGEATNNLDTSIQTLEEERKQTLASIKQEFEYKELLNQVFVWYRTKNKIRDKASIQKISALLENDLLIDASKAETFQSKISFFFTNALIHHILGQDLQKANLYYKKVVEIWDRYAHMKKENHKLYKIHLSNYLNSCHSIQKYAPFPEILEKIQRLPADTFDEQAEEFQNVVHLKLLYYLNTFQHSEAIHLTKKIETGIKKYKSKINKARELSLYGNLTILYFAQANYKQALFWIDKILEDKNNEHRKDIQLFARVIRLIAHYELKNYFLLESLYRSTYRGLKKLNQLHEFEKIVLLLIKALEKTATKKEKSILLKEFHNTLKEIQPNNIQKKIIGFQEISIWAYAVSHEESFLETLKKVKPK